MKTLTEPRKFGDPPLSEKSTFETNNQPQTYVPPNYSYAIVDPNSGKELEYRDLIKLEKHKDIWSASFSQDLYQLEQGTTGINSTDTIFFVPHSKIPPGIKVTYGRICINFRPQKDDPYHTRLTVGDDSIDYPWEKSTNTAGLTMSKLIFILVISTPLAKYLGIDIKHFYICTPLDRYEYMHIPLVIIPDEIIKKYNLPPSINMDECTMKLKKGMYGLPQAGILANKFLKKRLSKHGYLPVQYTTRLRKQTWILVTFSIVVDNFGVKYKGKEHALHLIKALENDYKIALDWQGKTYCDITLDRNYSKKWVEITMPGYIK